MRLSRFLAVGVLTLLWLTNAQSREPAALVKVKVKEKVKPAEGASCGEYGTSVHFEDSPSDAAKRALKEEKLVMVLHISGYFEDPEFT